ncbi:unnamed protein product [Acanthoscelides obtectus]|uniref:Receptor-type tyrosine-protein phosphatase N2 n=2 Tax=Acanthoscelides obtectus TaxID=200917 RepID=A0A9P0KEB4_ACAOB|nr:unnamed protein product [Acanthoscelides obtectus]CAK1646971.1 Receptor-type tyrosine-protein phosphatase N2 [Acanthoscelides obtectus]
MQWPGFVLKTTVVIWLAVLGQNGAKAEANVGCLYSERMCLENEWCYDDLAFGRCLRPMGDVDEEDLVRYELEREGLHELHGELQRLFALGYRWNHAYTQCRLQEMLFAFKNDLTFDPNTCAHLTDNDLEGALRALEGQVSINPQEIAVIKYTPSEADPHGPFADEVFYPPAGALEERERMENRRKILSPNAIELDLPDPYADYAVAKRNWIPQMRRRTPPRYPVTNDPVDSLEFLEALDNDTPLTNYELKDNKLTLAETTEMYPVIKFLNDLHLTPREIQQFISPENYENLAELLSRFDRMYGQQYDIQELVRKQLEADEEAENAAAEERFTANYNTPANFRAGFESKDSNMNEGNELPESRIYFDEEEAGDDGGEYGSGHSAGIFRERRLEHDLPKNGEIFRELTNKQHDDAPPKIYTEGGVVWSDPVEDIPEENNDKLYRRLRNMGFKRPERLDVKKPGPRFDTDIPGSAQKDNNDDNDFVHIELKNGLKSWTQGVDILKTIQRLLNVQTGIFSHSMYKPYSITFKVEPNNTGYNSYQVAKKIRDIISQLQDLEGIEIVSVGYGDMQDVRETVALDGSDHDEKTGKIRPTKIKKEPRGMYRYLSDHGQLKNGDMEYVYVEFVNGLKSWSQGSTIIRNISNMLHLEPTAFTDGKIDPNSVIFKVKQNSKGLNASEVARRILQERDKVKEVTGIDIISVGVGDKEERQSVMSIPLSADHQFYVITFLVCGILAATIVAVIVLIFIRRHIKSKEKSHGLARGDAESSTNSHGTPKKNPPSGKDVHGGRVTSLSRESEQSPSSRSSTSSWSEEPALHNMDISTGHMVLSYMEDHLKNKDRLEQEWVALCAYVAEPCETAVANKPENKDKNRYPDVVPYDHARVVLNELSNSSGSDYINASSITDHDPRNPAYIATQGPLPHTAPDFWQLIWEQGAVVIVMLTRLTEGGTAMCHRYWPEEGSELYHIYEVHLVSEHIWCDDYLVRSFYLKNVRTGETRTVTQFHFLSWPESGVPSSTKALLEFRRKVNKSYRGRSCPIVVHCSDGAGRTGTYCLIDMVLGRMAKGAKEIDIAATLEHLRDQRVKMVATKQQFEFVLTAVAEEVHAILKALPPQANSATTQEKEK